MLLLVALPFTKVTGPPKFTPSILNCAVPVGVPARGATAVTVAVKVTGCPKVDGFWLEVRLVVVLALSTRCAAVPELLLKLLSPLYVAVSVLAPAEVEVI